MYLALHSIVSRISSTHFGSFLDGILDGLLDGLLNSVLNGIPDDSLVVILDDELQALRHVLQGILDRLLDDGVEFVFHNPELALYNFPDVKCEGSLSLFGGRGMYVTIVGEAIIGEAIGGDEIVGEDLLSDEIAEEIVVEANIGEAIVSDGAVSV